MPLTAIKSEEAADLSLEEIFERLQGQAEGLSSQEARRRLDELGPQLGGGAQEKPTEEVGGLFLGAHPLDDRGRRRTLAHCAALDRHDHHMRDAGV